MTPMGSQPRSTGHPARRQSALQLIKRDVQCTHQMPLGKLLRRTNVDDRYQLVRRDRLQCIALFEVACEQNASR